MASSVDGLLPPEVLRTGSAVHTCQGHVKEVTGPDEPLAHAGRRAGGPGANAWHIAAIPPGGSGRHGVLASRFFRRQRHFRAPAVVSLPSCASARARGVRPGRRDTSVRLPPTHPHPPHTCVRRPFTATSFSPREDEEGVSVQGSDTFRHWVRCVEREF